MFINNQLYITKQIKTSNNTQIKKHEKQITSQHIKEQNLENSNEIKHNTYKHT